MNLIGTTLTAIASLLVFFGSRTTALLAIMGSVCYITQGQVVNVGGFNFYAQRIVLLVGFMRILARGEFRGLKTNKVDWSMLAFSVASTVIPGLRTHVWQESVGNFYNMALSYVMARCLVTDWEELEYALPKIAVLIAPLALCMGYESLTGINEFRIMGGQGIPWVREGRFRCIGSFRGPHTAGIFGAEFVPLFAWLYLDRDRRRYACIGLVASLMITYTSNSSGPLMCLVSGILALFIWLLREKMDLVRWTALALFVVTAALMKAPVWYLLAKVSALTGGDGWYRSYLMEQCYKHFSEWWLAGTNDTSDWATTKMSWGGADLCNIYVTCAASAGLLGFSLIILLFVQCFRVIGSALRTARASESRAEGLLWCLGCVFFAHVCTLLSVTYWDQFSIVWWGIIGIISSVTSSVPEHFIAGETEPDFPASEEEMAAGPLPENGRMA